MHETSEPREADFESEDRVVRWLARRLGELQYGLNLVLYAPLARLHRAKDGGPLLYFNYVYVFGVWTPILIIAYFLSGVFDARWWALLAVPAIFRWMEVAVWWVKLFVDREHTNILAAERNLVFLAADIVCVITGSAVIWRSFGPSGNEVTWLEALTTFTLNGPPTAAHELWSESVAVASALTALILIGAGLALVVGEVAGRINEVPGRYTGPRRPG